MASKFKADIRLGPELHEKLHAFKDEIGVDGVSAAARALIQLGLERSAQLDVAWRRIAWREGSVRAQAYFKKAFARAMSETIEAASGEG